MSLDRSYLGCRVLGFVVAMLAAYPCFADADAEDYERGMKMLEEARQQRNFERRIELLDEAEAVFQTFLKENPEHSSAYSARSHIGNILIERARMQMERARNTDGNTQAEARRLYEQAYEIFEKMEAELKTMLAEFALPPKPGRLAIRDRLRADYLQAQLLMAAAVEESADAYDSDDARRKEILAKAADEYQEVNKKYRTLLAGQYACFCQGRCLWKCGRRDEALQCLDQILDLPDVRAFSAVTTKALNLSLEIWLDDSERQYQQAAARGDEWLTQLDEQKRESPDSLGVQFRLARAHRLLAETLDDDRTKAMHQVKARALAEFVAERAGTFQTDARKLLADIGDVEPPEPNSFSEAKAAGRAALDEIKEIRLEIARRGVDVVAVEIEPDLETINAKPDPLQSKLDQKRAEAIRYFQLALKLADDQTPNYDIDLVRYFLCYLYYSRGAYEKAAELGDEVARNPDAAVGARQCAKIALASYVNVYQSQSPRSEKARGVVKRLKALADHILDSWPEEPEADETLDSLVAILISEDRADDAVAYLHRMSTDSPRRNRIELRVGAALWRSYLLGIQRLVAQKRDNGPGRDADAEDVIRQLTKTKEQAEVILSDAIERARDSKNITRNVVIACSSLAQILVDSRQFRRAVTLLEDPKIGPLTLVQDNHPAARHPSNRREIYKAAIRAYEGVGEEAKAEPLRKLLEELEEDDCETGR